MSPGPRSTGTPQLGDAILGPADLARRVDRMDEFATRLSRLEIKVDKVLEAVLDLRPASIPRRAP